MYCTQAGCRIMDFTLDLHDITDDLLFGQCISETEKPPYRTDFEASWSGRRDSNPRHPAWKAGTLPLSYSRETESILPQTLVGKQEKGKLLDNLILRSLDKSGQGVSRPTTKQILYPQNRCHKRRLTEGYLTYSLWCSRP